MFSFLYSPQRKMRENAKNWLEVADRVRKFRSDQLTAAQNQKLQTATDNVRLRLKENAATDQIKLALESLEQTLREIGGRIYPASSLVENVEFFLVAAIVILGLRAYFVQPFKIPTNSMWPSYYGMTAEVFKPGEEPGVVRKIARLAGLGATHYSLKAPADGEVLIPVFREYVRPAFSTKPGRSLYIFPTVLQEYVFSVGGELARIQVPAEFELEYMGVLKDSLFPEHSGSVYSALQEKAIKAQPLESSTMRVSDGAQSAEARVYWIPIGRKVKRGETILSFDILTGDLLFVDRLTYNFVRPKVGSGFVFKTGNIADLNVPGPGYEGDKYFVKRLVGVPGDTLEIKAPALFQNGAPAEGAEAFGRNARQEGLYPGYTNNGLLAAGGTLTVPPHSFFALGDNSPRSKDSRYWGFVPEKDVVGRPLFIYYPLTKRWGPAH